MNAVAILLCAGSGSRMRDAVPDKVLAEIASKPVFQFSLEAFDAHAETTQLIVVYRDKEQREKLVSLVNKGTSKETNWIPGGTERQDSVYNALQSIEQDNAIVFIHDCARPLISASHIRKLFRAASEDGAACLAHRVVDTIKQIDSQASSPRKAILQNLDRHLLWAMETPQVFQGEIIKKCYNEIIEAGQTVTDDTAAVIQFGHPVTLVENTIPNPKITYPQDILLAEALLKSQSND